MVKYRIIPDFPAYRIGTDGSLWTRWRKGPGACIGETWKPMKTRIDHEGYRSVELAAEDGTRLHRKVGAIVLRAFVGPPPEGHECRHMDGNPLNDSLDNLSWGTPLENHADKRRHGTIAVGERHGKTKLTAEQITELLGLKGRMTQQSAADKFGVSRGYVGQLWSGTRKRVPT